MKYVYFSPTVSHRSLVWLPFVIDIIDVIDVIDVIEGGVQSGVPGPLTPAQRIPCPSIPLVPSRCPWPSLPTCFLLEGRNFPNFPPGGGAGDPLTWAGRQMGQEPPRPCPPLPARSPAIYAAFVLFLIPLMFIICPTGLTDFVSCRAAAVAEPPRLPRSRLPAPSRADLVFRAAPRRISVCKTKCFDGGRLQECLEAVWSFMGCAVRAVLARRAGLPAMGSVIFSLWRGCCWKEWHWQGQQERGLCKNLPLWDPKSIIIINNFNYYFLNENAPCSTSPCEVQELVALPGQGWVMVMLLATTSPSPKALLHHSRCFPKAPQGSPGGAATASFSDDLHSSTRSLLTL